MQNKNLIIALVAVVALAGIGFWYWQNRETSPPSQEPKGVGAQIFEKTQNPVADKLPETNPFQADTNPFDANTNPYKDTYKNPFK